MDARGAGERLRILAAGLWQWLRGFSGDVSYEAYLRHAAEHSAGHTAGSLSAEEFYLDEMERKYSRPNRCC